MDGAIAATERASLTAGVTRATFRVTPEEPGFHTFRVVVEAARDTFDPNDRADANTIVKGEPRVLIAAGDQQVGAELVAALTAQGQLVDAVVPELIPEDLTGLAAFDSIVLVDVPRMRLSDRQLAALQVFVRDLGRGLVAIGGPRSYGAGGYTKTPLEETLPVDMGVRDREKQPDVALVVVIDKSGSMDACHCNSFDQGGGSAMSGVRKTDIGKEAILRAAAALTARDQLGVVAFDEAAHWVVKTEPLGDITDLQGTLAGHPSGRPDQHLRRARAGGAVARAGDRHPPPHHPADGRLVAQRRVQRHRRPDEGRRDHPLDRRRRRWLGTIARAARATGRRALLQRGQPVQHPGHLPEGDAAGLRPADRRGAVLPDPDGCLADPARARRGVARRSSATTARRPSRRPRRCWYRTATIPLLAQWQYGLGRSVAWTSDATGRWAKAWLGWQGFSRFFSQAVAWTFPGEETGGIDASFVVRGAAEHRCMSRASRPMGRRAISTTPGRRSSART